MKLSKRCISRLGRAMIMVFAVQVVAASICLMPAAAMAGADDAVMTAGTVAMQGDACSAHHGMPQSHTRHACPHCDAPDQAVSQIDILHGLQAQVPILVAISMPQDFVSARASTAPVERILAPPGSASLIYNTNQRIRI